jgi:L-threonylcarbamoyladenylate synthase
MCDRRSAGDEVVSLGEALAALRDGLVVGFPTDTVYGIGVDPFQEQAMGRLFAVKGRPEGKAIPILAADIDGVLRLAALDAAQEEQARRHWPGALTLVLPRAATAPLWVGDPEAETVAVRIPAHEAALELLARSGPLAVTSANLSGSPAATSAEEAEAVLSVSVAVYLPGSCPGGTSSTVVDLTGTEARVLRYGPVVWEGR